MNPFRNEIEELNELNNPFYVRIGLLSVRFSEIESLINHIIEKLINSDDNIISSIIIEQNVLDKNLKLVEKLCERRDYEEKKIKEIVRNLRKLKTIRNFFIHGVWSRVINHNNENIILCANHKWIHEKNSRGSQSTRYKQEIFTLKDLESTINKAGDILKSLKEIWEVIKDVEHFD